MKSLICLSALIGCLSVGNVFAQGRGGGRAGGPPEIPTRPEPAVSRPSAPDVDRGNPPSSPSDRGANAKADARKAEGKKAASQQLSDNPMLVTRMKGLFPEGTDLGAMADGFENLGLFVAAAHVSHNLNIPFDQLKTKVVTDDESLGDAIHALKPDISTSAAKAEAKKAEAAAKKDMNAKG